jgi:nitrous oxidase accessory protein NosD
MKIGARVLAWSLIFAGITVLLFLLPHEASAANDPPAGGGTVSGDWTVTDTRAYSGCTITLNGNLIVSATGDLDLGGVMLIVNCPGQGSYGITVQSGGELTVRSASNITSSGPEYKFQVLGGGKLTVTDSIIKECGYSWGSLGENAGIYILSSNCNFTGVRVLNCYYGVVARDCAPAFTDCRFENDIYGVGLVNSSASFTRCGFNYDSNGANLEKGSPSFDNCTFASNTGFGMLVYNSPFTGTKCDFALNSAGNCVLMNSDATISWSTFRDSIYGIYVSQGTPSISDSTFYGNRQGMYAYRTSAKVLDCKFDHNSWYGLSSYYATPTFIRCSFSYTGYDPGEDKYYGIGVTSYQSNFTFVRCTVDHDWYGMDIRYSRLNGDNVSYTLSEQGIHSTHSDLFLTGCNFTLDQFYGIFATFFSGGSIERCRFTCETFGVYMEFFSPAEVLNSTFTECRYGLKFEECGEKSVLRGCQFDRNSCGAFVVGSYAKIYSNRFANNVNYSLWCIGSASDIRYNLFTSNPSDSLTLESCAGSVTENQFVTNDDDGIYCMDSTTEIANNTFTVNGATGVYCYGKKCAPNVHHNTFFNNEIGIALFAGSKGVFWANNITQNKQTGIMLTASFGEIYENNVTGGTHGISILYNSFPSVHDNRISGNEGGVVCNVGSNASIWHNTITNNSKFGISVLGSWPELLENTVTGSLDGIRVTDNLALTGKASLSGNFVANNTDGLRATNAAMELAGCNFTGNANSGVYMMNSTATVSLCSFYMNDAGLYALGGTMEVVECDFVANNNSGIETEAAVATIRRCFFNRNTDGILDFGNSTLSIHDGIYQQDLGYGLYCSPGTRADWYIEKASTAFDERFWLAGNLTVSWGASLRLTNVTLFMFLETPGEHYIEIQNGADIEIIQNSTIAAGEPDNKFSFRVLSGGNMSFMDSSLRDCGDSWGAAGERGGLLILSSACILRNLVIDNCTYGLITNGVDMSVSYLTFTRCGRAVEAVASSLRLDNCSIWYSVTEDLELQQSSKLVLYNTSFTRSLVNMMGAGNILEVYWYLNLNVAWQNKVVVSRGTVNLADAKNYGTLAGYTNDKGWLMWIPILEYRQDSTTKDIRNPYNISVRLGNVTNSVELSFEKSFTLYLTLRDMVMPYVEIIAPAAGARINYTPVNISGLAFDLETGLDRVEVSFDGRFWELANGTSSWNFLARLNDANYTLYVRASDAVGNRGVVTLNFTVDTVITLLDVSTPTEGYLTRYPVLWVNGTTEADARITVNGREVSVANGRFTSTVTLSDGNNTILVSARDAAGNTATVTRRVVVDTVLPYIDFISPRNDSYINQLSFVLTGRTEPGANLFIGGLPVVNADGRFTQSVPIVAGVNSINVTAIDGAGNSNSTRFFINVDLEAPTLSIESPRYGYHTGKKNITVNGTTEPYSTLSAGEFFGAAGADGKFRMNVSLLYGNNTLIVKSRDRAGNTASLVWHVVRESPTANAAASPWAAAIIVIIVILAIENLAIYWYFTKRRSGGASMEKSPLEVAPKHGPRKAPRAAPPPKALDEIAPPGTSDDAQASLNWDAEKARAKESEDVEMPVQFGDQDDEIEEF